MEIMIRATVIFFFLWLLARGVGKRELAELTAFELIMLVTLGDLVQQGVTQEDMSITGAMIAVGTIGAWILVFSFSSFRWPKTRPVLEGLPVVILRDGELVLEALRLERVTIDEVKESARNQGISDLTDIVIGVLEPDGRFSFIKTDGEQLPEPPEHKA
jgi:uncharacterized membrane protein YcaP (DUF421 family)